jgi:hypothetical protein
MAVQHTGAVAFTRGGLAGGGHNGSNVMPGARS